MKKQILYIAIAAGFLTTAVSCNRFLDVTPTGIITPKTLQNYRDMLTTAYNVYPGHKAKLQIRTDEVKMNMNAGDAPQMKDLFSWNDATPDATSFQVQYDSFYNALMYVNQVINGAASQPESSEKNQLLGEAHALRALIFFEVSNIYAPVYNAANADKPAIVLTLDTNLEGNFPKSTLEQTYAQIQSDIDKAKSLLNVKRQTAGLNYRFSTIAVEALETRVKLYKGDWQGTVDAANKVLSQNGSLENLNTSAILPQSFKSVESIMNLDLAVDNSLASAMWASDDLVALYDKTNDLRFAKYFTKSGNNYKTSKYKSSDANASKWTFRVSDVMLMKAEALVRLKKDDEAKQILSIIAENRYNAAGLANFKAKIAPLSGDALLSELMKERQRETAFDGLRWYDLRRTSQPAIVHVVETQTYKLEQNDARYTLIFPAEARRRNPNL